MPLATSSTCSSSTGCSPGRSGVQILRGIRAAGVGVAVAVLVLTTRDQIEDRVEGLDAGADDYLPNKPVALAGLLARLRALTRRVLSEPSVDGSVRVGGPGTRPGSARGLARRPS